MNTMFADMNARFAEQSGKMTLMQWQLGAVMALITVIGGVSIFAGDKLLFFVTTVLTDCSSSLVLL